MKIQHLFLRKNPAITTFTDPNAFGPEQTFSTGVDGFQIAIAADHFTQGVRKDPRYLQFIARLYFDNEGSISSKYFKMHPCTEEDFEKFYPIERRSASIFESFKKDGGLYCIDWQSAGMDLFGSERFDETYQGIDIAVIPCGMSYTLPDGSLYEKDENECAWDKEEFIDYLGDTYLLTYFYNHESFHQANFQKDNRVEKDSRMGRIQADSRRALYIETYVELKELVDEVDLVQIGQQDLVEFFELSVSAPKYSHLT